MENKIGDYAQEAKERWGDTEAYKQSIERYGKLSEAEKGKIEEDSDTLMKEIAESSKLGPESPEIQSLIDKHYNNLRNFYEPNLKMYRGLGNMYVEDERFQKYFDKYSKGLAQFMREAINIYCDSRE